MKISAMLTVVASAAILSLTFTSCSDDSNDEPSAKEVKILVTKQETKVNYRDERAPQSLPEGEYDVSEIIYDAKGYITEWWSNNECAVRYTYSEGKIHADDVEYGSFDHMLSPEGKVVETVYADNRKDKFVYDIEGQCVALIAGGTKPKFRSAHYEWTDGQMTRMKWDEQKFGNIDITYSDIPKKSNGAYTRALLLNYGGYFMNLEMLGNLNISSEKYLPQKAIWITGDGVIRIFEATYDLNPDGTVKTMHITLNDGWASESERFLLCDCDISFTYKEYRP